MREDFRELYEGIKNNFGLLDEYIKEDPFFIFQRDFNGETLLCFAVEDHDLDLVKYLIERGACPIQRNDYQENPLLTAAEFSNVEILKYLVGISECAILEEDRKRLLARAVVSGRNDNVKYLIENGCDPNWVWCKKSMISWANYYGHDETAELLSNYCAD